MYKKLLSWLKNNRALLILTLAFFLVTFIKCVYFSYETYFSVQLMTMWGFIYIIIYNAFVVYIIISSFVLIFKKKYWIIIFSILLDLWILANVIYFRFNGDLLGYNELELIDNMRGFWSSIFINIYWRDSIYFILTIILCLIMWILKTQYKNKILRKFAFILILFSTLWLVCRKSTIIAWDSKASISLKATPIYHFFSEIISWGKDKIFPDKNPIISENDIQTISYCIKSQEKDSIIHCNVILILVESLESWIINAEINNCQITPYINKIINDKRSLYAQKVIRQTKGGTSSDAQLIINTGLLPTKDKIVCRKYCTNKFYNLANALLNHTKSTIIATDIATWNQRGMSYAYGYDTTIVSTYKSNDYILFSKIKSIVDSTKPYFIQAITCSSHTPFTKYADSTKLKLPSDMPKTMRDYIASVNFTDKCFGILYDKIMSSADSANTIIAITGDHTIFNQPQRDEFNEYVKRNNIDIDVNLHYTPLIIMSPNIKEHKEITEEVYQMDIYPTLLNIVGGKNYIWQGLGIDLLNDTIANRKITEEQAYDLSDKIIKNDYFKHPKKEE